MSTRENDSPVEQQPAPERVSALRLVTLTLGLHVVFALFMFVPAGTLAWGKGWLFQGLFLVTEVLAGVWVGRTNPELLAARSRIHKGTKSWDKLLMPLLLLAMMLVFSVAALDDARFGWYPVPWWVCLVGYLLLFAGMAISTWAGTVNKFAEPSVRIQTERGHRVIDTGPYAIVRHPAYASAFLLTGGSALALGSLWALLPAAANWLILVVRTVLEDRTLQAELPGYREYAGRVRYRLLPGVW